MILTKPSSPNHHPVSWTEPNTPFDDAQLNQAMLLKAQDAIDKKYPAEFFYDVINTDRSIGARISGEIAKKHGNQGMSSTPIKIHLRGTAGQSFGVWNAEGLSFTLQDANDYVGEGMAGGKITIKPHQGTAFFSLSRNYRQHLLIWRDRWKTFCRWNGW